MKDLALHILDIAQNSTRANASLVEIAVVEDSNRHILSIAIKDNGCGMPPDMVQRVADPFVTSRTTRKVGLGIPLLKQSAEQCGGDLSIQSDVGVGTCLTVRFRLDSIDLPPWGDIAGVVALLAAGHPEVDFIFCYTKGDCCYSFDTREVKEVLGDTPISSPQIVTFMKEMIAENLTEEGCL